MKDVSTALKNSSAKHSRGNFERELVSKLESRMNEKRKFMQIVMGPRQTGKTTAIFQALEKIDLPHRIVSADMIAARSHEWLQAEWQQARSLITNETPSAILVIDEVQNIEQWSSVVKALWDEDAQTGIDLRAVLSGSSYLLIRKGLSESLMGRFELLRSTHWCFSEMHEAFGYSLEEYLSYGGYPAGASLKDDVGRWYDYMNGAVIEATLSKDVFQLEDVRKPALMRSLLTLGCQFSAQEISYRKILGQLDDKGNTVTVAHYLELLAAAGLLCGIQKFDTKELNTRKSSPRLMVFDTSLIFATSPLGTGLLESPEIKGHIVESSVGAYLLARSKVEHFEVFWWRDGNYEVDFVLRQGDKITAIEVKSGRAKGFNGLIEFMKRFPQAKPMIVGDLNTSIESFLSGDIPLFN